MDVKGILVIHLLAHWKVLIFRTQYNSTLKISKRNCILQFYLQFQVHPQCNDSSNDKVKNVSEIVFINN